MDLAANRLGACDHAPLAAVARACGFHDAPHLQRHFLRPIAMTPGAHRRAFGRPDGDLTFNLAKLIDAQHATGGNRNGDQRKEGPSNTNKPARSWD